ncbi:hypothetical protein Hamer_G009360 [Homarus americanus]|uniref:Uncharacterized protein n=1 Tax=Homarus americanus TaxID=6706 RepID=A0A8J5J9W5_HOMAM|nr:hypothetical protein Hamer_G009360 [Homarus americanus]
MPQQCWSGRCRRSAQAEAMERLIPDNSSVITRVLKLENLIVNLTDVDLGSATTGEAQGSLLMRAVSPQSTRVVLGGHERRRGEVAVRNDRLCRGWIS